ncbi:flagellar biosynthetic protein FliO [Sporosarcina beigongshangi]|uniref:flagellar biosynthetic protein FliO n=1 Tax=Sporosarcina beigongshangi TaxID=2782538 RepID=UPI001939F49A|nr:flagellar biosynthetic protein FliO [Sporosarcina beigongshangi]
MIVTTAKKYLSAFLLTILLVPQLVIIPVQAQEDPNKSVSDYWDTDKESNTEKENDTEINLEPDTDEPIADPASQGEAVGSSAGDYIKVMVALLFVVGLLYGLLKLVNRKNRLYDKNRFMKNMGGISLGQHKSIQLVIIGDSYYLVGVGDDIRLLKEITDPAEISKLVEFYKGDDMELPVGMLSRLLGKLPGISSKDSTTQTKESADFGDLFKTKLDEMKEERKRHISRLTEKERNEDE